MPELRMPSLGADMDAGTLVAWRVGVGDRVERGAIVADVETDKGVIAIEAHEAGLIAERLVEPGVKVVVGAPLARLESTAPTSREPTAAGERARATLPSPLPDEARSVAPEPIPSHPIDTLAPGRAEAHATPTARRRALELGLDLVQVAHATGATRITLAEVEAAASRVEARVSPRARRRARALGVDFDAIAPRGGDGPIVEADVLRASAPIARAKTASTPPTTRATEPAAPLDRTAMRRAIGRSMARSKREIPHYYVRHAIELGAALDQLARDNETRPIDARVLPAALLLRAVVVALGEVPALNARWDGERAAPVPRIDLGVAVALRGGGLLVPVIADAARLDEPALMAAVRDATTRARGGALRASDLGSATITVTLLGDRGVDEVIPVIHPPEVAIVGFGTIAIRPWVVDGEVRPRPVVLATLAADHRVTDGHEGARFLAAVTRALAPRSPA
jgi:pyruvate dehydrogenase E2 component (dihydrolipoamide acetyltransferase)